MQMNFCWDKFCKSLKNFSRECEWISSTQQFGHILEKFGSYAIEFWLGHKLEGLKIFYIRYNWVSAETQMGVVLDFFRYDAIEF